MINLKEKCSLFKPYLHREYKTWCMGTKPEEVNIIDMLAFPWQPELLKAIRAEQDEPIQKEMKKQLWAMSASSLMIGGRGENYITRKNGLIAFDIDTDKNPDMVGNYDAYFEAACKVPYTLYAGRSARGKGVWGLFRIQNTDKFRQHFDAMSDGFLNLGIIIDQAPSSAASIRFISYDENAYYNENAKIYTRLKELPVKEKKELETKKQKLDGTDGKVLIARFNSECTPAIMHEILSWYGFTHSPKDSKADKHRFFRPGKDKGTISVDYECSTIRNTLHCFSDNVDHLDKWTKTKAGWGCSPLTALRIYGVGWPDGSADSEREHWANVFGYIKTKL